MANLSKAALAAKIAAQTQTYKADLESLAELLAETELPTAAQEILNKYKTESGEAE